MNVDPRVKKVKMQMMVGLMVIVVVGLAIAVYFVFLKDSDSTNMNKVEGPDLTTYVSTSNGSIETTCYYNADCILVDIQNDLSECCPRPNCTDYEDETYVAVNKESYQQLRDELQLEAQCQLVDCPQYSPPLCPETTVTGRVTCTNNVCQKEIVNTETGTTTTTSNWQTHTNITWGFAALYPDTYLVKLETDGFVTFDASEPDTPDTTFNSIGVNAESNDFHTYRLGVLTNAAVDNDKEIVEEDVTINGLDGQMITYTNQLGEKRLHYIVTYLGTTYDITLGDSVDEDIRDGFIESFVITQLPANSDITDTTTFSGKTCASNNDCGAYPCNEGECLVQECSDDSECAAGTCGQYVTPVPGYCTTIDVL